MAEEMREQPDALRIPQVQRPAAVLDRPVVAFMSQHLTRRRAPARVGLAAEPLGGRLDRRRHAAQIEARRQRARSRDAGRRRLAVSSRVARQQHGRLIAQRLRDPCQRAHALVAVEGLVEQGQRLVMAPEDGGEQPGGTARRAETGRARSGDEMLPGEGLEQPV